MSLESDARFAEHVRDCANKLNDAIVALTPSGQIVRLEMQVYKVIPPLEETT
jgi:hypothetical protein